MRLSAQRSPRSLGKPDDPGEAERASNKGRTAFLETRALERRAQSSQTPGAHARSWRCSVPASGPSRDPHGVPAGPGSIHARHVLAGGTHQEPEQSSARAPTRQQAALIDSGLSAVMIPMIQAKPWRRKSVAGHQPLPFFISRPLGYPSVAGRRAAWTLLSGGDNTPP